MKQKIKNKIQNNMPYLVVSLIIFFIVVGIGVLVVNGVFHTINDTGIRVEDVVVTNKYYGEGDFADYYLVEVQGNKTYSIINHEDNYGQRMFNNIKVGGHYEFTLRDPGMIDTVPYTHILKVKNDTMQN